MGHKQTPGYHKTRVLNKVRLFDRFQSKESELDRFEKLGSYAALVYKEEENICFRALFIIDPEGKIVTIEKCDLPVGVSMEEQLRQVQAAMVMQDKDEGGTPADWEEGQPIDLTGFKVRP